LNETFNSTFNFYVLVMLSLIKYLDPKHFEVLKNCELFILHFKCFYDMAIVWNETFLMKKRELRVYNDNSDKKRFDFIQELTFIAFSES